MITFKQVTTEINVKTEEASQRNGMANADEPAGARTNLSGARNLNGRPSDAKRLTMAQAVADKWIARYAGDDIYAVACQDSPGETNRH